MFSTPLGMPQIVIFILIASSLSAQEVPFHADPDEPLSRLGWTTLHISDAGLLGTVESVTSLGGGRELSRIKVVDTLWGQLDESHIMILTTVPGVFAAQEGRILVFVQRMTPGGKVFTNNGKFSLESKNGKNKLEILKRVIEIESIPDIHLRETSLRAFALRNLKHPNLWTQWNAAQEFFFLIRKHKRPLSPDERGQIADAALRSPDAKLTSYLHRILQLDPGKTLSNPLPPSSPPSNQEIRKVIPEHPESPPPTPASLEPRTLEERIHWLHKLASRSDPETVKILIKHLDYPNRQIRASAAFLLGSQGQPAVKPLLSHFPREPSPRVRQSVLKALAQLSSPESEDVLLAALREPETCWEAAYALATLSSDRARKSLQSHRDQFPANDPFRDYLDDLILRFPTVPKTSR
ncbi:MAG: HEAT repeat domain-containing protein [Planctomycetota bacterium]|jgi:hypothetical protein|nr:HEAT repeat domain-containing protein [Planctomycetota bacterium]